MLSVSRVVPRSPRYKMLCSCLVVMLFQGYSCSKFLYGDKLVKLFQSELHTSYGAWISSSPFVCDVMLCLKPWSIKMLTLKKLEKVLQYFAVSWCPLEMSVGVFMPLAACIVSEHQEGVPWTRKEEKRRAGEEGGGNGTFNVLLAKFEFFSAM